MGGDNSKNRIEIRTLEAEPISVMFYPNLTMSYTPKTSEWDSDKTNEDKTKQFEDTMNKINQQKQDADLKEKEKLMEKEKKKIIEKDKQQSKHKRLLEENEQLKIKVDYLKKDTIKLQIQSEIADQLMHDLEELKQKYKNYDYYNKEKIQDIEHKMQEQERKQRLMQQNNDDKKNTQGKSPHKKQNSKQFTLKD